MWRFLRKWLLRTLVAWLVLTVLLVLPLRWLDPPTSAFMLQARLAGDGVVSEWRDLDAISRHLRLAVIAAEDQRFPRHYGFDLAEIHNALEAGLEGGRMRGASTLTQQLARNLYLWPGRNWLRKGLEAWFTPWLELCLGKARILELYLNIAEFDRGVYGAEAASRHYFGIPAARLTRAQAALLAAALPNPKGRNPAAPDAGLRARQVWILEQMDNLGSKWAPGG